MPCFEGARSVFSKKTNRFFLRTILLFCLFIVPAFFICSETNVEASGVSDFLCELGIKYYKNGRFSESLHEFKKALILDPANETALEYIQLMKNELISEVGYLHPSLSELPEDQRQGAIEKALDRFEEVLQEEEIPIVETTPSSTAIPESVLAQDKEDKKEATIKKALDAFDQTIRSVVKPPEVGLEKKETASETANIIEGAGIATLKLSLDDTVKATQPLTELELQIGRPLVVEGENIAKFLIVDPEKLSIERKSPNEIVIIAQNIGSTYLHIWDNEGRWTFNAHVSPFRIVPTALAKSQLEEAGSFKLRYSNEWASFNTGRRLNDLNRQSYSFYQNFGLDGQSPYGDLDASMQLAKLQQKSELTYYTLGLEDGKLGPFKGFDLRLFDYYLGFNNLGFGGAGLRGVKLDSEVLDDKLKYSLFWGRENQGIFSPLSPGVAASKDAYIEGGRIGLDFPKGTYQTFSLFHGYGSERDPMINENIFNHTFETKLGNTKLRSDFGYDTDSTAYLLGTNFTVPKLQLTGEFRNINENYYGITGRPFDSGKLGGLVTYRYNPSPKLQLAGRLDTYRDRLFPNPEHDKRYNLDFNTDVNYYFDDTSSLRVDYYNTHDTGTISSHIDETTGVSFYKTIDFIKKLNTYVTLMHQTSENLDSPTLDYKNEKATVGLRLGLTDNIYYFASKEVNWLRDYTDKLSRPNVFETGVDYNRQVAKTPFYLTSRLYYRDEEDATAPRSFLAGEDNLEVSSELRYQPSDDFNAYINLRANNIWAENPDVNKRLEGEVRLGMRWTFDTNFRWNPIGHIAGVVFKDLNSDGVRQADEPVVKGIKIMIGSNRYDISDSKGKYSFRNIRARKIVLSVDSNTLPGGFVLTGAQSRDVFIEQGRTINVDFGIISRSEIYGVVFNDINGNGKFDSGDKGIKDVVVSLEDKTKVTTDGQGQYYFRNIATGTHKITLDINSLPINFIPQVPIFKDIELFEGVTYIYNIPLINESPR